VLTISNDKHQHLNTLISQINALSREELTVLNKHIVKRSKSLDNASRAEAMAQFNPGDLVSFIDKRGSPRQAIVMRTNIKTVSLTTIDDDERWNVAPEILTKEIQSSVTAHPNTISFPKPARPVLTNAGKIQEWVGGSITMPAFVTGEPGDNYQPTMAVWLNEIGQIVGMDLLSPTGPVYDPIALLKQTIAHPNAGPAGAPSHIRINDKKIAEKLQKAFTTIQVTVAPTPELDTLANDMLDMPGEADPQTFSEITVNKHTVESFFESTAALYKSTPWKTVPHDECLIGVTVDSLGLCDAVLCVIGQMGESFGIVLFESLQEYERYTLLGDAMERGVEPDIPPHRALNFENANEIPDNVRKDIALNRWTVAEPNAYPSLMAPVDNRVLKPLTEDDIELFDVIAQAIRSALSRTAFVQALIGGPEHSAEYQILTTNRPAIITLQAPYPYERVMQAHGAADNLIAQLLVLERVNNAEPDWDKHNELKDALLSHYYASPESQSLDINIGAATLIMDFAFNYCECTIATITPLVLDDILFSIIPRKVMIKPEDAADIINDCRAFLLFLQRAYGLERVVECLTVLDDNAIALLANALGDGSKFGMGKSVFSSTDSFPTFDLPNLTRSATEPKPADKKSRKKKRSASRKARKKNR
jgi:hypothetical protein